MPPVRTGRNSAATCGRSTSSPTEAAAQARFEDFTQAWGEKYPAIVTLWRRAWAEFVPFLDYDAEIRKVICSTNVIESLNARYRRAVRARGHFPTTKPRSSAST